MRTVRPERAWLAFALVLACFAAPARAASDIGTLFYSAAERARLDRLRRGEMPAAEGAPVAPGAREVTGFIKRSDGKATVWIDGVPVQVAAPRARELLEPKSVRGYGRDDSALHIERRAPP